MKTLLTVYLFASGIVMSGMSIAGTPGAGRPVLVNGPDNEEQLKKENFEGLFQKWETISDEISTYHGLKKYCSDGNFQADVDDILLQIHLYDSLLTDAIVRQATNLNNKKVKKALKSVADFEEKYKAYHLSNHLGSECRGQQKIDRHYRKTRNNTGIHSYDNQVIVTEAFLRKYVKNINGLMKHIDKHFHLMDVGD